MYVAVRFKDCFSVIFGFAKASVTRRVVILNSPPPTRHYKNVSLAKIERSFSRPSECFLPSEFPTNILYAFLVSPFISAFPRRRHSPLCKILHTHQIFAPLLC
jgi:hypothetical protein